MLIQQAPPPFFFNSLFNLPLSRLAVAALRASHRMENKVTYRGWSGRSWLQTSHGCSKRCQYACIVRSKSCGPCRTNGTWLSVLSFDCFCTMQNCIICRQNLYWVINMAHSFICNAKGRAKKVIALCLSGQKFSAVYCKCTSK